MAVLSDDEALKILRASKQVPAFILAAREKTKTLSALFVGEDFKTELSKVEHIEKSEEKWQARQKYSRSIVDLNERVFRPIDNVYSATGGTKDYDIESPTKKKKLIQNISNVRGGESLQDWLETNWMPVYHYDPSGVIFLESSKAEDKERKSWPTYKSIYSIRNYAWEGQYLEWILFEPKQTRDSNNNTITLQRLVDAELDRTYKVDGDHYTLIEDLTFKIEYGACPGIIDSNITKVGDTSTRLSPAQKVVEIEQEYLRDQSILTLVKFLNGFKNLIRPKIVCPTCRGTGKSGNTDCKDCDKGYLVNRDVTDEIIIPIDITNENVALPDATTLASWLGLDVETWDQYRKELGILEVLVEETIFGTHQRQRTEGDNEKTATGRFIDTQPVINRLDKYSGVAEQVEEQLSEWIANYQDPAKDKDTKVVAINYGKRFIIDSPDVLLKIYSETVKDGLNEVVADRQMGEYVTAKYKNDVAELRKQIIKTELALYIHYTIDTVNEIYGQKEAQKKGLFRDWWETLTDKDLTKDIETLKDERDKWLNEQIDKIDNDKS